ncbi:MAG: HAD-IA family hydrolase [Candidatus Omnitrophota bacterium]|nr:HAD-IA family hydrolase [Candidatus Omnitrophota bacterium]
MPNKIIIFDFDGTIADTFSHLLKIGNRLADEFDFKKIQRNEITSLQKKKPIDIIKHLNVPILKIPVILRHLKRELHKEIATVELIPGLKEVLPQLKKKGHILGILSSNSSENVATFLRNHNLDFFDFVTTTSKLWSKNIQLKKIIKSHKLNRNNVIYVGDEKRDIIAAKKAKIKVAAVTWGYNSAKVLAEYHPDYLIKNPQELLQL